MGLQLDLVGIATDDLARSIGFYRRLGVEIPEGAESAAHAEVTLPGGLRLAWDRLDVIRGYDPAFSVGAGRHPLALAFRCADPGDVDRVYDRMAAAYGGHLPPWDAPWGQRYAVLLDPDGNTVDLFAPSD